MGGTSIAQRPPQGSSVRERGARCSGEQAGGRAVFIRCQRRTTLGRQNEQERQTTWLWSMVLGGAAMTFGCADEPAPAPPGAVAPRRSRHRLPRRRRHGRCQPNTRFSLRAPDNDAVKQIAGEFKTGDLARRAPARRHGGDAAGGLVHQRHARRRCRRPSTRRCSRRRSPTRCRSWSPTTFPFRDCARPTRRAARSTPPRTRPGSTASPPASATARRSSSSSPTAWGSSPTPAATGARPTQSPMPPATRGPGPGRDITGDPLRAAQLRGRQAGGAARPRRLVYLDGTHSGWLNVGDASTRLAQGGVAARARVLPQRLELPALAQPRPVRHLDLGVPGVRDAGQPRRLRGLPEPVLERRPPPLARRAALR